MAKNIFSIRNKIFLITGGLGQLGQIFIHAIVERGGKVAVLDIIDEENKSVKLLKSKYERDFFLYKKADVTKKEEISVAVKKIVNSWGAIDVLINNAALDSPPNAPDEEVGGFEDYPEELYDKIMKVNVKGTLLSCQVVGKYMSQREGGAIINISSIYGIVSPDQSIYEYKRQSGKVYYKPAAYSISKSSIINFTRYLATYWAKRNIRVNTLTLAGIFNNQPKDFLKAYTERIPIGRMANPEEVIGYIIFLSSEASSYMIGSNLIVDGGWTAI